MDLVSQALSARASFFIFTRKGFFRLCGPGDWRISFPANLSSPTDASSQTCGQGRRTIFLPDGSVFSVSGLPSSIWARFPEAEKYTHPRGRKARNEGKRNEFEIMEDVMTLVLIIVLCLLFKPLISAILRGLGSSEHRRDR